MSRTKIILIVVAVVATFLCWRVSDTSKLEHSKTAGSGEAAKPDVPLLAAVSTSEPNSPQAEVAQQSRDLQSAAYRLMQAYEARRLADDPVGADVERLRFLDILSGTNASLFVRTLGDDFLTSFFGDLALRHWASHNREQAAAWMAQHPLAHPVPAAALANGWMAEDPRGLSAYLDGLPAGTWKHLVAKSAAEETLVANQPQNALALLGKVSGSDPRADELKEWAVTKWAMSEPEKAAEWAQKSADPLPLRERLLAAIAIGQANIDPKSGAERLMQTLRFPDNQLPAFTAIARIWAARDPDGAARWINSLPAGPLRTSAEDGLLAVAASGPRPE